MLNLLAVANGSLARIFICISEGLAGIILQQLPIGCMGSFWLMLPTVPLDVATGGREGRPVQKYLGYFLLEEKRRSLLVVGTSEQSHSQHPRAATTRRGNNLFVTQSFKKCRNIMDDLPVLFGDDARSIDLEATTTKNLERICVLECMTTRVADIIPNHLGIVPYTNLLCLSWEIMEPMPWPWFGRGSWRMHGCHLDD